MKSIAIPASVVPKTGLQWINGGRAIAYVADEARSSNIWSQPVWGGSAKQITHFAGDRVSGFVWTKNGEQLPYRRDIVNRDALLHSGDGQVKRQVKE